MIKKLTSLLLTLLVFATTSFAQQKGTELLIKANKASLERNYNLAIEYYSEFIKLNPKDFRGYFNRGTTEYNANKFADGVADFTKCIELNPIYKEAYYYRAKCNEGQNKNEEAIKDYTHILDTDSMNIGFLKARANCYQALNKNAEALEDLNMALKVNKIDGAVYKQRAEVKVALGKHFSAIQDYDMVEALMPAYKMVHYLKGNLYLRLEMTDEACEELQTALDNGVVVADRSFNEHCVTETADSTDQD